MFRPLLILLALAITATPAAGNDWFSVEVIVFEHREDASSGDELWPRDPGRPGVEGSAELSPGTLPPTLVDFERLDPDLQRLTPQARALERSARYRLIVHSAWQQIARGPGSARPLRFDIESGRPLPAEPLVIELPPHPEPEPDTDSWPEYEAEPEQEPETPWIVASRLLMTYSEPPPEPRLSGTIRLSLQRFLHIDADLVLQSDRPLPELPDEADWRAMRDAIIEALLLEEIDEGQAVERIEAIVAPPRHESWRLTESRRVRSGEVHYFDHPRFGVIVSVNPVPRDEVEMRMRNLEEAREAAIEERELLRALEGALRTP